MFRLKFILNAGFTIETQFVAKKDIKFDVIEVL